MTTLLTYLDNCKIITVVFLQKGKVKLISDIGYPELEGDESRRAIWLYDVPLGATHHLRHALNNRKGDYFELLQKYEIPVVASALKLYLLELPGKKLPIQNLVYGEN